MSVSDDALIGDGQTCALVSRTGSIDFLCWPRFDSQACFAALLGDVGNRRWQISPSGFTTASRRRYRGDTKVLETEFTTDTDTDTGARCASPISCRPTRRSAP